MGATLESAIATFHAYVSPETEAYCTEAFGESFTQNPYNLFARMREAPIVRSERFGGFWIFTTYEDVHYVYKNPELFSSYPNPIPADWGSVRPMIPVESDPPEHTHYRQVLAPLFGPREMEVNEPRIREVCHGLIDRFADAGRCEFVGEFARLLPATVFVEMMGWPSQDAPTLLEWSDHLMNPQGTEEEIAAIRAETGLNVYNYFAELIDDRHANPGQDILSKLVTARYDGRRPLTQFELLDILFILLTAGLDTTKSVLGTGMLALATRPDMQRMLKEDPSRIPNAVEEILRFESPTLAGRRVTRDFEYKGIQFREGDRVMISTGAADRDPGAFDDPDMFDIARFPNRHLAFGAGPHRCLGSHLARLELRVALEVIHERMSPFMLDPDDPAEPLFAWMRGVERLPLIFGPAAEELAR